MHVNEIMSKPVVIAQPGDSLESVARQMLNKRIGSVVVVDPQGRAAGIITESDFAAHEPAAPLDSFRMPKLWGQWIGLHGLEGVYAEAKRIKAEKIMQKRLVSLKEDDPAERAVDLMMRHELHHLPVLRDGKPVGMVAHHDLLKLVKARPAA
jgi:CBS domain-containing protein